MRATVMFNGTVYSGDVIRETPKRMLVKFTTGTGWTRESWFAKTAKPEGNLVSRRAEMRPGDVTIPANSGFFETPAAPAAGDRSIWIWPAGDKS